MEKRELICINCPLGCMLTVEMDGKKSGQCIWKYLPAR